MSEPSLTRPWYLSPFTGLLRDGRAARLRACDPEVPAWAGLLPHWGAAGTPLSAGGAGWTLAQAEGAGLGEAVERWRCRPTPQDTLIETSIDAWPLAEPPVPLERWVLFHPEQYATPGFPFARPTPLAACRWVCCRETRTGKPWWVPVEMVFLEPPECGGHTLAPALSTGLAAGRHGDPVLLRGLQEVIERDAVVGAWWGAYPLAEEDPERIFAQLGQDRAERLRRPNLRWRCYRIGSPFSAHVTLVTLTGADDADELFSIGSACRETQTASWDKAILEAVQGRHYVRHLLASPDASSHFIDTVPVDFIGHAIYYSLHPERLRETVLHRPQGTIPEDATVETLAVLAERLGTDRPVLVRNVTPPGLLRHDLDVMVLRVVVPGLQPLHGHDGFPFLGGPLWGRRPVADWLALPPHPFP
jgi:thiazole/oxazole-forming peptide maturase SagD family component